MAVATTAAYWAPGASIVPLAVILVFVSLPCVAFWAAMGGGVGRLVMSQRRTRLMNRMMGLLLAASAMPMLWQT